MDIWPILLIALIVLIINVVNSIYRKKRRASLYKQIQERKVALNISITEGFAVQSCPRCQESEMVLLDVSPNARTIHYQCLHCGKKLRAGAATPLSSDANPIRSAFTDLALQYNHITKSAPLMLDFHFSTPLEPLPYEKTTRTPIPEVLRGQVWRRDGGRCVNCGSKENLQFDHIIPVSRGGATSAQNLQLLCQKCNLAKRAKI
jgi:hypothetical protein